MDFSFCRFLLTFKRKMKLFSSHRLQAMLCRYSSELICRRQQLKERGVVCIVLRSTPLEDIWRHYIITHWFAGELFDLFPIKCLVWPHYPPSRHSHFSFVMVLKKIVSKSLTLTSSNYSPQQHYLFSSAVQVIYKHLLRTSLKIYSVAHSF